MVAKLSRFRKRREGFRATRVLAWVFLGMAGLLGMFLLFYNVSLYQKRAQLEEQTQELRSEIAELAQKSQELQGYEAAQETEAYQERVLREQGLYQKPGEEVVTILPAEEPQEGAEEGIRVWWKPWTWFAP